ncbi:MAG: hypothetical protein A3F43_06575 [Gammaproteobacteria bacterium RIFCSPHIGHO2_12_FULL_42_10]|nr:MAG: hypothetical protein A3F43_06575 [Gammaproteobacteria bacterium RIFCSPHIGHO2_12_FULL_42_10]
MIISEIQNKLATWSSEDKTRRFNRVLRLIANRIWLQEAARITLASSGANTPGVDNMNKEKFIQNLPEHLDTIRTQLLSGTYQPQPASLMNG